MKRLGLSSCLWILTTVAGAQTPAMAPAEQSALTNRVCSGCHNDKLKSGGMTLTRLDFAHPEQNAELAEKVIQKVRAGLMPPAGIPRPDAATLNAFAAGLEQNVDKFAAAHPNPGRPSLHRLNRFEYANSVRDLLALDIDPAAYLPADDSSHGFDNMAEVLNISPTLMEGYVRAAGDDQPAGGRRSGHEPAGRDVSYSTIVLANTARRWHAIRNPRGHRWSTIRFRPTANTCSR